MACSTRRERELIRQGWHRQFIADEPRLGEAVEEYRALGFLVHLETVDPAECQDTDGCMSCFALPEASGRFKIIFTRPGPQAGPEGKNS